MAFARNMGDESVFREDFLSAQSVAEQGGVITGGTFNNGLVQTGTTDKVVYQDKTQLFNSAALTVVVEFTPDFDNDSGDVHYFYDSDGNRNYILLSGASGNMQIAFNDTQVANIASATVAAEWVTGSKNTLIISSTTGATSVWLNGTLILDAGATSWSKDDLTVFTFGNNATPTTCFTGTLHRMQVFHEAWTAQEAADEYNGVTYSDLDASKSLIYLPGRTRFSDGANEVTENLGTEGDLVCGDGTTSTTYPTFSAPKTITFDGGDYLETAGTIAVAAADSWLFHCRFMNTGSGADSDYIFDLRSAGNKGIWLQIDSDGKIRAIANGASSHTVTTDLAYDDGAERDLVAVWNDDDGGTNQTIAIYIDGVDVKSDSGASPDVITEEVFIGDWNGLSLGYNGTLKDVGLWRTTGTPRQARWLYKRSLKELNI